VKTLKPENVERLLIRGTNWVGDAVMSIPALREIRRIFPRAHISLLVQPWVRDVYSSVDFIDCTLDYDKSGVHKGWTGLGRLVSELRRGKYQVAILLQNALEAAFIAWMARIPVRVGYARDGRALLLTHACRIDPSLRQKHQAFYYLGILSAAGLLDSKSWEKPDCHLAITIGVRDADRARAREMLRMEGVEPGQLVVGLNPGAYYGSAKRWLSERYAAVAETLAEKYRAHIVIFGSAAERPIADEIATRMTHRPVIFSGRTTLAQLMALICECTLLITNDSGPMHLAAALDVPQLAIFGSSSEIATGPLSRCAEVIKEQVECSPCFLRDCPIDFRCMTRITVEQVLNAAEKKLKEFKSILT
jgi:heptosyltransferase-2